MNNKCTLLFFCWKLVAVIHAQPVPCKVEVRADDSYENTGCMLILENLLTVFIREYYDLK